VGKLQTGEDGVIRSYRTRQSARFAKGERIKEFEAIEKQARRRLTLLESAESLSELARVPSNRLEALRGNRVGQHSIRINDRWRICFTWNAAEKCAELVETVDYH
jgi:proteic killer suppression protein